MKIKQTLAKIKPAFSFFDFYYNVIKGDKKKYELASGFPNNFYITITPLFFMIVHVFIIGIFAMAGMTLFAWIPVIIANFIFSNAVSTKGREIKRKEEFIARETERYNRLKQQEKERAEYARREQLRWERKEENMRKQRERQEKIKQEQYERMYKDFFAGGGYEGWSTEQKSQSKTVDQNIVNAMKLMSLKEGFTKQDLKSAYRKLSKIHHPDVKGGSEANFKKLITAYEYVLERI